MSFHNLYHLIFQKIQIYFYYTLNCNKPLGYNSMCYTAVEGFRPFSNSWWIFPLLCFQFCLYELFCLRWFCYGLALNGRFSVIGRVLMTELYAVFWDVLILGCALIVFEKLLCQGFGLVIILLRDPRVDPFFFSFPVECREVKRRLPH